MTPPSRPPEIIAHRGLSVDARENTLPAFERAFAAGARAIELDVHCSKDGIVVVHHDPAIRRVSGGEAQIRDAELDELQEIARDDGWSLPTLTEVLRFVADRATVYIEIKAEGIELPVARVVRDSTTLCAVHSFNHRTVSRIRDFVPGIRTGILLSARPLRPARLLRDAKATDYWPHVDFVDPELVSEIHEAGGQVIVWTANSEVEWARLIERGVDGICTDRADLLAEYLSSAPAPARQSSGNNL